MAEGGTDVTSDVGEEPMEISYILSLGPVVTRETGKLLVSPLTGLTFSGYIEKNISLESLRWVSKKACPGVSSPGNCFILSYLDLESMEVHQLFFDSQDETKCLNSIKDLIDVKYQKMAGPADLVTKAVTVVGQQPVFFGNMLMKVEKLSDGEIIADTENQQKEYLMIIDVEAISLYLETLDRPVHQLHFWKDADPTSLEKIKLTRTPDDPGMNTVILQTETKSFSFLAVGEIVRQLQNLQPKPKHVLADPKQLLEIIPEFQPSPSQTSVFRPQYESKSESPGTSASYYKESSESNFDANKALTIRGELANAVANFEKNEDMQNFWVTIESDLKEIIESGTVPESDHRSGGLNPDDGDHLEKALSDVEDQFRENNLPVAISRLRVCRELFTNSKIREIRSIFDQDDMELLRALYFKSLC